MGHFARAAFDPLTGKGIAGGSASIVVPGTQTLLTIYSVPDFSLQKTNPLVLLADSMIDFYIQPGVLFDLILKNQQGVVLTTIPNLMVHRRGDFGLSSMMIGQQGAPLDRYYVVGARSGANLGTINAAADVIVTHPLRVNRDRVIDRLTFEVVSGGSPLNSRGRLGIYDNVGIGRLYPGALLAQGDLLRVDQVGHKPTSISLSVKDGQTLHFAFFHGAQDIAPSFRSVGSSDCEGVYGSSGALGSHANLLQAGYVFGVGELPNPFPANGVPVSNPLVGMGIRFAN